MDAVAVDWMMLLRISIVVPAAAVAALVPPAPLPRTAQEIETYNQFGQSLICLPLVKLTGSSSRLPHSSLSQPSRTSLIAFVATICPLLELAASGLLGSCEVCGKDNVRFFFFEYCG